MIQWLLLASSAALLAGGPAARADQPGRCPAGHAVFGRVVCATAADPSALLDAYFLGATSLGEVEGRYGERLRKFGERCRKKLAARGIAAAPSRIAPDRAVITFRISTVEACAGRRTSREPCARDADCLENFCHPERGTCGASFTVPLGAAY